jgi:hypothetical protein
MATAKKKIAETNEISSDKNDMVVITLDRPRFVRFGHRALKKMTSLTGFKMDQIDEDNFDLGEIEKIMWCGLLQDAEENNEVLKLEDMEMLLDKADFHEIINAMNLALEKAFQKTEKEKN